jgi:peptide/nickel transport system substrate-binding protein
METQDPVIITKLAGYGAMIVPPKYIQEHGSEYFGSIDSPRWQIAIDLLW